MKILQICWRMAADTGSMIFLATFGVNKRAIYKALNGDTLPTPPTATSVSGTTGKRTITSKTPGPYKKARNSILKFFFIEISAYLKLTPFYLRPIFFSFLCDLS